MTTLVVHESMFGNTRAIAEAIAADLPGHVEVVDVTVVVGSDFGGSAPQSSPQFDA